MKVLVSGASGFVGRHALQALQAQGIALAAIGRQRPPGVGADAFIQADLLDPGDRTEAIARLAPTHLLHLAWYAEHGTFWEAPVNLRWVDASVRLAEAFCAAGGRHIVAAGTCAEYAWEGEVPLDEAQAPLRPASLYGVAKDATRRLLEAVAKRHDARLAWARIFLPYGAGEHPQRLLPALLAVFRGERAPFAVGTGNRRDFLAVEDLARALLALLRADLHGSVNVCSGQAVEVGTVLRQLAIACRADPAPLLALAADRPGEPRLLVGDTARLRSTGWHPQLTLARGLAALATGSGIDSVPQPPDLTPPASSSHLSTPSP